MKLVIIGGAGLIGSKVVANLTCSGCSSPLWHTKAISP